MLNFLNQNGGTLTVIFSFIVAISTVVYAILTWKLTSETTKMREAQTTPNVLVTVEPEDFHEGLGMDMGWMRWMWRMWLRAWRWQRPAALPLAATRCPPRSRVWESGPA